MVRAWFINEDSLDENRLEIGNIKRQYIHPQILAKTTGILAQEFGQNLEVAKKSVDILVYDRGYSYEDCLEITPEKVNLQLVHQLTLEHLHDEEETRFVLGGCAYLDVRSKDDSWIRIEISKGDLIIVPPGLYHRLTLTKEKALKLRRFFLINPNWTSINRPDADNLECRRKYLESITT